MHLLGAIERIRAHSHRWSMLPFFPSDPIPAPPGHPESDEPDSPHKGEEWPETPTVRYYDANWQEVPAPDGWPTK